ncbi:MAG: YbgC/FadM family acyl-CoA thioesterase [Sulfurospirillum sp.]|nr:YbgC/FadM family acyl-CoA thioesterase [Sulfurospirillum sp.]
MVNCTRNDQDLLIWFWYNDTDAGGIVYHANYLKFCERARSELFFVRGLSPVIDGGHFVVKRIEADFIRSAKLGDLLEVRYELLAMKNTSLRLVQTIYLQEEKIFEMMSVLVYVKYEKPAKIPLHVRDFFTEFLG